MPAFRLPKLRIDWGNEPEGPTSSETDTSDDQPQKPKKSKASRTPGFRWQTARLEDRRGGQSGHVVRGLWRDHAVHQLVTLCKDRKNGLGESRGCEPASAGSSRMGVSEWMETSPDGCHCHHPALVCLASSYFPIPTLTTSEQQGFGNLNSP